MQHRVRAGAKTDALVFRRQKAAAPKPRHERLAALALGHHHDERRQVVVLAAEPVVEPRADAGSAGELRAGLHMRHARAVVDRLGVHRADEAQVIGDAGNVRQHVADLDAALAARRKLERRPDQRQRRLVAGHRGEPLAPPDRLRQLGAMLFDQRRLGIEQVELRRAAALEQINDALGLGREVRSAHHTAAGRRTGQRARLEQAAQRDAAQPHAERIEETAPAHPDGRFKPCAQR